MKQLIFILALIVCQKTSAQTMDEQLHLIENKLSNVLTERASCESFFEDFNNKVEQYKKTTFLLYNNNEEKVLMETGQTSVLLYKSLDKMNQDIIKSYIDLGKEINNGHKKFADKMLIGIIILAVLGLVASVYLIIQNKKIKELKKQLSGLNP